MRLRQLQVMTIVVAAMVVFNALITPVILLWSWLAPQSYAAIVSPIAGQVDRAAIISHWATVIAFSGWIYIAGKNLIDRGYDYLEFSPASRIWWFAVPFANLIKPFQGMRELWNVSRGDPDELRNHPLIVIWWGVWISGGLLNLLITRLQQAEEGGVEALCMTAVVGLVSAALALALLFGISRAQSRPSPAELVDVFA